MLETYATILILLSRLIVICLLYIKLLSKMNTLQSKNKDKDSFFSVNTTLNCNGRLIDLSAPVAMGIVNITPDSFYKSSRYVQKDEILQVANQMITEGAAIIDLGACSTRPGANEISIVEEKKRLFPALEIIREKFPDIIISVDTFRSSIAYDVVKKYEVAIINDISAGQMDPEMFDAVAELHVPYVLMHMKGTPRTMQKLNKYENLLLEITMYFAERVTELKEKGVSDIILDPGFGFAKSPDQNLTLLKQMDKLRIFELPVLAGLSRKSTIWKTLDITADEAMNGTTVLNTIALLKGAKILRVHDIKPALEAIKLMNRYNDA